MRQWFAGLALSCVVVGLCGAATAQKNQALAQHIATTTAAFDKLADAKLANANDEGEDIRFTRAEGYATLAAVAAINQQPDVAKPLAARAIELAQALEDEYSRDVVRDRVVYMHALLGQVDQANQQLQQMRDVEMIGSSKRWIMVGHAVRGDRPSYQAALKAARTAAGKAWMQGVKDQYGDPEYPFIDLAWTCAWMGDFDAAAEIIRKHVTAPWTRAAGWSYVFDETAEAGLTDAAKRLATESLEQRDIARKQFALDGGRLTGDAQVIDEEERQRIINDLEYNSITIYYVLGKTDRAEATAKALESTDFAVDGSCALIYAAHISKQPVKARAYLETAWKQAGALGDEADRGFAYWMVSYQAGYIGATQTLVQHAQALKNPVHHASALAGLAEGWGDRLLPKYPLLKK